MKIAKILAGLVLMGGVTLSADAFAQDSVAPRLKSVLNTKLFAKFCGSQLLKASAKYDKRQDEASLEALLNKMSDCEEKFLIPMDDAFSEIREDIDPSEDEDEEGDDDNFGDGETPFD